MSAKRERQSAAGRPAFRDFNDICGGAVEAFIITPFDAMNLAAAATSGDARAAAIMRALNDWINRAVPAERGTAPLCLDCTTEFTGGAVPAAFALAVPSTNPVAALVSGVCYDCAARTQRGDGLMASALRGWRAVWPDLRAVEGGRA